MSRTLHHLSHLNGCESYITDHWDGLLSLKAPTLLVLHGSTVILTDRISHCPMVTPSPSTPCFHSSSLGWHFKSWLPKQQGRAKVKGIPLAPNGWVLGKYISLNCADDPEASTCSLCAQAMPHGNTDHLLSIVMKIVPGARLRARK